MSTTTKSTAPPTELALDQIAIHPNNVRMKVSVDPEFVRSIKARIIEPLVVAPFPPELENDAPEGAEYVLIAGHRRLLAAKRAKLAVVPVRVLEDLTALADQVEAMLEENMRRADLSPIEEGDAYLFLMDNGRTQQQIADKVHRDKKTVSARVKVARLSEPVRKKLHAHQMTLDAAMAIAEFSDDPDAQARLTKAVGTYDWEYLLRTLRSDRQAVRARTKKRKGLEQAGVKVLDEVPPLLPEDPWVFLTRLFGRKEVEESVDRVVCEHRGVEYSDTANGWDDIEAWHQATCSGHAVVLEVDPATSYSPSRDSWKAICTTPGEHAALLAVETDRLTSGEDGTPIAPGLAVAESTGAGAPSADSLQASRRDQQVAAVAADRWRHVANAMHLDPQGSRGDLALDLARAWTFSVATDDDWSHATRQRRWQATLLRLDPDTATSQMIKIALKQFLADADLEQLVVLRDLWSTHEYTHATIDRSDWPASGAALVRLVTALGWEWTDVELEEIRTKRPLAKAAGVDPLDSDAADDEADDDTEAGAA